MKKKLIALLSIIILSLSCFSNVKADSIKASYSKCKVVAPSSVKVGKTFTVYFIGDRTNVTTFNDWDERIVPQYLYLCKNNIPIDKYYDVYIGNIKSKSFNFKTPGVYEIGISFWREVYYDGSFGFPGLENEYGEHTRVDQEMKTATVSVLGNKVKAKFNANKGKVSKKSKTVQGGKKYGKLPTPKRKGYKFKGWYTKKSGGRKVTKNTSVSATKKHTLYAHWFGPKGKGKTITKAEYKRIKRGMTYSQVKYLVGGKGKLVYSSDYEDYSYRLYSWKGRGSSGANADVTIEDGYVIGKSQHGLR